MVMSVYKSGVHCTLLGDGMVGKTCLARSFADRTFPVNYVATVMDTYSGTTYVDGNKYGITLTDMAGEHDVIQTSDYTMTDVFIICYSVVDRESFESVQDFWAPQIKKIAKKRPVILVATQTDLRQEGNIHHVTSLEGETLAKLMSANQFKESSAFAKEGVSPLFKSVVHVSLKYHKKRCNIIKRVLNSI
ncbi:cell division control protein 42 homolog [Ylistrum balloti]|uniref:cell division control protein 42 homolog n=1 Tax=Ylistrum balloti TaxID=509963 RepID=UPI0029058393|nr:cell division control protein 42 homolog [Ylistrum balloti]